LTCQTRPSKERPPVKRAVSADQNAFRRFDSRPCGRVRLGSLTVRWRTCLAPVRPVQTLPPSSQESCCPVLSHAPSVHLTAPLDGERKMLLVDLCNRLTLRVLVDRSNPALAACATTTALPEPPRGKPRSSLKRAAPARLSATRPRVSPRLTARAQLRPPRSRIQPRWIAERVGCYPEVAPPCRGVVDHAQGWLKGL